MFNKVHRYIIYICRNILYFSIIIFAQFQGELWFFKCSLFLIVKLQIVKNIENRKTFDTYKLKVSLYFGDQLFDFDFVANFLFLSCKFGPIKLISTNGRNIPD